MCGRCELLRRGLIGAALLAPFAARARGTVEPVMRVAGGVAVTLDACPGGFDHRVADALVSLQIPATIFVTAIWMRQNPDGVAFLRTRPDIFTIENHGARHLSAVLGDARIFGLTPAGDVAGLRAEVMGGAAAISQATGRTPIWYRAGGAIYSPAAIPVIEALGMRVAGFSLNADVGASLPAAQVAQRLAAARVGDVTEGHINQPHRRSGAGIAEGLAELRNAGVRFVGLG